MSPETQLRFDVEQDEPPKRSKGGKRFAVRRLPGRTARRLLFWAPVWMPLCLLVQVALLGVRPASAERARVEREEARSRQRIDALLAERSDLLADVRRLEDGVYRERVRRSLRQKGVEPLTLSRAAQDAPR